MSYVEINQAGFEYVLNYLGKSGYSWKVLDEPNSKEKVYMVSINDIHVKVFSSVVGGVSRGVGADAIRVVLWDIMANHLRTRHPKICQTCWDLMPFSQQKTETSPEYLLRLIEVRKALAERKMNNTREKGVINMDKVLQKQKELRELSNIIADRTWQLPR